ncbi:hypothetical protein I4U23_012588 [Adineta vaga]|nr:hypothetical protein I4U23_012588 [Adineta vaga]
MSNPSQFDVATAALEHLELLNRSNQNPLEIAAQFRTLLRSKKPHSCNVDYTYTDYITADATLRRQGCFQNLSSQQRSKSSGKIQCKFNEDQSMVDSYSSQDLSKCQNITSSVEDMYVDSGIVSTASSNASNIRPIITEKNNFNRLQYPTINWRQLREKQNEQRLNKVKQFISTKFHIPGVEPTNLSMSSLTTVTDKSNLSTYSNPFRSRRIFQDSVSIDNSISRSRSDSSSPTSIRTPSISPINSMRSTYTITRLDSTSLNDNNEDIFVPIADCNLIIKHKANGRMKRLSHYETKYFRDNPEETIYI